jgi:hypothetical protein
MKECDICNEKINKSTRLAIACEYCGSECCRECFNKFALETLESACMFCKKPFKDDFIESVSAKKFFKEFKDRKFEIIFSREKSLLVETQPEAELILKQKADRKIIHDNQLVIKILEEDMKKHRYCKKNMEIRKQFKDKIAQLENENRKIRRNDEIPVTKTFIMNCPDNDCRGFLSSAYNCGICNKYFCPDCLEKKVCRFDDTHICNSETKETMKLLKTDTKKCPNCRVPIFKTDGCDQMYCITCHTAFSWNTGKIETGRIHNPEYFRYLRDNGKEIPRDAGNQCNMLPYHNDIPRDLYETLDYMHHIRHVMETLPRNTGILDYKDLRLGYLLSEYDEISWKRRLNLRVNKYNKNNEIFLIYDMFYKAIVDLFNNFSVNRNLNIFMAERNVLIEYVNKNIANINKKYKSVEKKYFLIMGRF